MKKSKAIALVLCGSLAIFGVGGSSGCHSQDQKQKDGDEDEDWEPEPVWVNGEMGVLDPTTHVFVSNSSPVFLSTCDTIKTMRAAGTLSIRGGVGAMGGKSGT